MSRFTAVLVAAFAVVAGDLASAQQGVERRPAEDVPESTTPIYADKANVLQFYDAYGALRPVKTVDDWQVRVRHLLGNMQRVMGPLPAASTEPLDMRVVGETSLPRYVRRQITFVTEPGDRLSGYLLVPRDPPGAAARHPAMICLPGSSAPGKDAPAGLTPAADMAYAHELAERGYVCLVLDYPLLHTRDYAADPYALGYASATMKGIVNHRRGVDLLASLPGVDAARIGVIGHSLGGHNALFLAAFEPRVRAVVSSCGFNVFAKHNHGDVSAWSSRYYMPRIKTEYGDDPARIPFDFTELLAALAPRAVFVNAPLHDAPDFEVSGVRDCVRAARPVFRDLYRADDKLRVEYPDAGHTFPPAQRSAAYDFLDRHLAATDAPPVRPAAGLAAHWPLVRDGRDVSGNDRHAVPHGVRFSAASPGAPESRASGAGAEFDGRGAYWEVPAAAVPKIGKGDFSLALRIDSPRRSSDLPGDLICRYDPQRKRGFQLALKTNAGVTFTQANRRHLQFGIDDDHASSWTDCGRPGNAVLPFALAAYEGALYAGTCEPGKGESGRVYRYAGGQRWIDCGAPGLSNSVTALAVYDGKLYAGTGKYRLAGSALTESENPHLGGKVYRYEGGARWSDCGQLPGVDAVGGLVEFRGRLYASSLYKPAGFFRYEQGAEWTDCGVPDERRVEALGMYDGFLYATSYDGGRVYRFDGAHWTDCGTLGDNTQTYSFAVYRGRLYVGTWPSGRVFRFEDVGRWTDVGRLGGELEVMGMLVHNGRLIAGTLPLAEVYEFDGTAAWRRLTQLDATPDVKYRRAWTMAEHDGALFCGTLPSGRVYSFEAGKGAAWESEFPEGSHHVAAVKNGGLLKLYVDGREVARSATFDAGRFDLDADAPLYLGRGMNDDFQGRMSDVRLYDRALTSDEVRALAELGGATP